MPPSRRPFAVLTTLLLVLLAPAAGAQLHPVGPDLTLDDLGRGPAVAVADDGSFAVAWADPGPDPLRGTVRIRRLASDGTEIWAPIEVGEYLAGIAGHVAPPVDLVVAHDGSVLVLWSGPAAEDPQRPTIYLRRFLPFGVPADWTLRVPGANPMPAFGPRLALRPDGLMVGAWIGVHPDGRSTDVFAVRLNQLGQHYLPVTRVHAGEDGAQRLGDVAVAPDDRFAVAWRTATAGAERLRVRVFGPAAQPLAAEVDLGPVRPAEAPHGHLDEHPGPALAGLADGRWILAWEGAVPEGAEDPGAVLARRLEADGSPAGAPFPLSERRRGEQETPDVAATPRGFVAVWAETLGVEHPSRHVFGRTFDLAAGPLSGDYPVPAESRRHDFAPVVAAAAGGGVVATLEASAEFLHFPGVEVRRLADPAPGEALRFLGPDRHFGENAAGVGLAPLGDGFVVVWSGVRGAPGVFGQRLQDDADPANSVFFVGPPADDPHAGAPQVASGAESGTFVVTWSGPRPGTGTPGIYARLYDGDNFPISEPFLLSGDGPRARYGPRVAMTPEGSFLVAWTAKVEGGGTDVFARRLDRDADPIGSPFRVNAVAAGDQELTGLAIAPDGLALAVWRERGGEGEPWRALVTRIHPGNQVDSWQQPVADHADPDRPGEGQGTVVHLADDTWLVAFSDGSDVVARRFRHTGALFDPVSPEIVLHAERAGVQSAPALAARPDGGFVAAWTSDCPPATPSAACTGAASPDGSGSAVLARVFDADLWPVTPDLPVADDSAGFQDGAAVAAAGDGAVVAWITGDRGTGMGPQEPVAALRPLAALTCPGDPGGDTVCLADGRFLLEVEWEDFQGGSGRGSGTARGDDWATFWFFHPANVELAVKVLDGRPVNGHWWVFYASLTNVPFRLWVHDLATGASRLYENPPRQFASRGDTLAFAEAAPAGAAAPFAAAWAESGEAPAGRFGAGGAAGLLAVPATAADALPCTPSATRLCLQGSAFAVEIAWQDFAGNTGTGRAEALSTDSGWFWFFRPGNPEVLVKVLDGRPVNGHFWVFYASLTNVAFELSVDHPASGKTVVYENPLRHFASRGDTTAFP